MPRRTRSRMESRLKASEPAPLLDLTPDGEPEPLIFRSPPGTFNPRRPRFVTQSEIEQAKGKREREAAARQREAAIRNGIDWSVCIVPGCGKEPPKYLNPSVFKSDEHNPDVWLPVCDVHGSTIWRTMNKIWKDPEIQAVMLAADSRYNEAVEKRNRRITEVDQGGPGVIYFLRQNGLVKVGWTSQLENRLKAYGPNVQILCHYPGSRQDETNLHRQLRGSLAKGREWYHDDDAIALFVKQAIERHGPPTHEAWWSQPKPPTMPYIRTR